MMKLALYNQPRAFELSVKTKNVGGKSERWIVKYTIITDAMNSSKFIESFPISAGGNLYHHANFFELNPPIPCSHASEIVVSMG